MKKQFVHASFARAGGLVLVHTTFGDLLRSLEPQDNFGSPQNVVLSREGLAAVHYDKGHIVAYTVNGKTLRHVNHSDNIYVSYQLNASFDSHLNVICFSALR